MHRPAWVRAVRTWAVVGFRAAGAALFHRITPAGSSYDGDTVFALGAHEGAPADAPHVEALAVVALEEAIERAVRRAVGLPGLPGLGDRA